MSKKIRQNSRWVAGISDFLKEGTTDSYAFGRKIDHRSDPRSLKLNPKTIKESGSVIEDLPKWAEITPCGEILFYGDTGKIYKRDSSGVYTKLRQAPNSHGNGMSLFGEDNFIYYTSDKVIGRYGPVCSTNPQFSDDFFGSQGGVPLNTNSLWLQSASSQYAYRADTASLSITGDLSIEAQIHPLALPGAGESHVIASKWNGSGNIRSYKFDITTQSNYFGDGSDGALTISTDTTDSPIDSACSGTIGATTLSATNTSFATGQVVLIIQMYTTVDTVAGTYQRNKITGYTAGTITLDQPLNATYGSNAQVIVMKQYTNVTVNNGKTWTAKAWNGTVGGILTFLANGTVTNNGTITATGKGYNQGGLGRTGSANPVKKQTGEGNLGYLEQIDYSGCSYGVKTNYGSGGGYGVDCQQEGGGGGGNSTNGVRGLRADLSGNITLEGGYGGTTTGSADLTTMTFGGQGGGGSSNYSATGGNGGAGGGIIFISGTNITNNGSIVANGSNGGNGNSSGGFGQGGGAGAGGSILLKGQVNVLGSTTITAIGGTGGNDCNGNKRGGDGGLGYCVLDYYTSYTGTTSPTLNAIQDSSLGASDGYVLRLQLSSDGTTVTSFSKTITPVIDTWQHVAVSWDQATVADASKCQAEFFYNAVSIGSSQSSTLTISDNASEFFVGANKNDAGTVSNFYDGYIDEVRLWSTVKSADDYMQGINQQILTTLPYLKAYWKFNGDYTDATANANTLTAGNAPTFVTDVPFPSPTTRLDIDQSATTTGNTTTLATTISEATGSQKVFTPAKDPQKSIAVLVAAKGTGDWTLTVHDSYNNEIASKTVTNANMAVGYYEFVFATPWRPLINANYHFHITSTVADGTVTSTNVNDLSTVSYRTYFQFLVEDTAWHPIAKMLQFLVFGNERYIATYEATLYNPNAITLPAGYKVRCFGYYKEYLAIGTTKGATLTEQDSGRIYFWDGIASTYNFYLDVPEGGINALLGAKGKLWVWAGYQGDLLLYSGGDTAEQIKRVPNMEIDKYIETYPSAVSMWRMLVRYGISNGDSTTVDRNVYTWGSQNIRYPESLSNDYTVSTGNYGSTVKIGLVMTFNKKLLIGYQDNVSYAVDYIDASNDSYSSGSIEHLLSDDEAIYHEKEAMQIVVQFEPLITGQTVTPKYKIDRASTWTYGETVSTAGEVTARLVVATNGSRYREIQYGADITTSVSSSPKVLGVTIEREFHESEERVG